MRAGYQIGLIVVVIALATGTMLRPNPLHGTTQQAYSARANGPQTRDSRLSPWDLLLAFLNEADHSFAGWVPRCQLIDNSCGPNHQIALNALGSSALVNFRTASAPALLATPQRNSRPTVLFDRSVWFNSTAATYIRDIQTNGKLPSPVSFPAGSFIARPAWGIVRNGGAPNAAKVAPMPIYNPQVSFIPDNPAATNIYRLPAKAVDLTDESCNPSAGGRGIPIGCFFHVRNLNDSDAVRYQTDNERILPGDTIVLLGFHLVVKECMSPACAQIGWKFATFWWQAYPGELGLGWPCQVSEQFCAEVPPAWRHYVMNRVVLPANPNDPIKPVMNPYIEGGVFNNGNLNCVVCHSFAAFPPNASEIFNVELGAQGPTTKARVQQTLQAYMGGKTPTDDIWTVATFLKHQLR